MDTIPFEILVHIFKYLPKSDRKSASETCLSWYEAGNEHYFLKKKYGVFYKTIINDIDTSPLSVFEKSQIAFENFLFISVEITSKVDKFWEKLGEQIKSLTFRKCDICEKVVVNILKHCRYLKELNIEDCKELFMSGCLLEEKTNDLSVHRFDNLKSLSLAGNQYLTDALLKRFLVAALDLEQLNLSRCQLQFHNGLVRKFYPQDYNMIVKPSESVLTFHFILQYITTRASNIKKLILSNTLIDGTALKALSEVQGLELITLEVSFCDQITTTGILALTTHQITLRELDIGFCSRVTDNALADICNNLINLEYLNIQKCFSVTDIGIYELKKLKKIKHLNISECDLITTEGLKKGICAEKNYVLEKLDIHSINIDQTCLITMSEQLPNLRFLNLSFCFHAVTDTAIQAIFKNQTKLKTLKISHCDKVSDAGFTGMVTEGEQSSADHVFQVDVDYYNDETRQTHKIHLGSKAEEEIVRDARHKNFVKQMCEHVMQTNTGYSITELNHLCELDISGCNKISDVSLTYAFKFTDLVELNISKCQQITHKGLIHLVENCPCIEYINLTDCYNLNDEAVTEIVKRLKRLEHLILRGCKNLTNKTIDAIEAHCRKLKVLILNGCYKISPDIANNLIGSMPLLHTLSVSL